VFEIYVFPLFLLSLSSFFSVLQERINSLEKNTEQGFPVNLTDNEVINKHTSGNEQLKV